MHPNWLVYPHIDELRAIVQHLPAQRRSRAIFQAPKFDRKLGDRVEAESVDDVSEQVLQVGFKSHCSHV